MQEDTGAKLQPLTASLKPNPYANNPLQTFGRPSTYDPAIADEIVKRISGGKSLRTITAEDGMPSIPCVYDWMDAHPDFAKRYAQAREDRADAIFEETLEIADDGRNDWMERNDPKNAGWVANGEHVQRSRLRVDTRKWFIAKLHPAKYGEQQPVNNTQITVNVAQHAQAAEARLRQLAARHDPET